MNTETQKKLAKIFVLTDLLIQEIDDDIRVPTPETKKITDKAKELREVLEPVLSKFYDNKSVKQSNFFQTMQNKFEYIFNKEYKTK